MATQTTTDDRLDGWEAISHYLGWTPRTVIRWEKQKGLPVHRGAEALNWDAVKGVLNKGFLK